jgi:hypothetical protein
MAARRRAETYGLTVRFQETLRRLAATGEGFVEDGAGLGRAVCTTPMWQASPGHLPLGQMGAHSYGSCSSL